MTDGRLALYRKIENQFSTKLIVYITSDRASFETQISQDVIDIFINQLDKIGIIPKISLYLYTRGGDTMAAWNLANLLRLYCDEFEVIIPHKAHSAGTLISLGANRIIMTKQATLGPIDPSINTPLNPPLQNHRTYSVSVEAVKGYLEFASKELGIKDDSALASILIKLSDHVHPLVLGAVYRSRAQIKMLAERLLKNQIHDPAKLDRIISFLCSESGSHDYTINRREAKDNLGLNIIKPSDEEYTSIKALYDDIDDQMRFSEPFDPRVLVQRGDFSISRALIESIDGGSSTFVTNGTAQEAEPGQVNIDTIFEGWVHSESSIIYTTTNDDGAAYRI